MMITENMVQGCQQPNTKSGIFLVSFIPLKFIAGEKNTFLFSTELLAALMANN